MREMRLIDWVDSMSSHGWETIEEAQKLRPMHIFTAGFVLDEADDYVTIAQSYDEREDGRPHTDNLICIPKFAIVSMREMVPVIEHQPAAKEYPWVGNGAHV